MRHESFLEECLGLRPKGWICVGNGYSREDLKAKVLASDELGRGLVADAFQNLSTLAQKIARVDSAKVLQSPARQEVLRLLLSTPGVKDQLPELKRLKRQGSFWRRLDTAIQAGRMAGSHWEELEVYSERLRERRGENPLRDEIEKLARAYEAWLEASELWDPPLLLKRAVQVMESDEVPSLPEKIYFFTAQFQESLERSFWDELSRKVEVIRVLPESASVTELGVSWERWHTLDDAAERLGDELVLSADLRDSVILISDVPSSRRTLKRALAQRDVPLSDPRDPTRIRWDEAIKAALLPLDVTARGFERSRVVSYLSSLKESGEQKRIWIKEINERGIRNSLPSFSGGKLLRLEQELRKLNSRLGGKKTVTELAEAHLHFLTDTLDPDRQWVLSFFEAIWRQLIQDLERVGLGERRAATLYWLERLQQRVTEAPAPVEKLKPSSGIDVYRLHQAPPKNYSKVFVFGIPAQWFSAEAIGDYWFSGRDREILSSDFTVRSSIQIREERLQALRAWLSQASEVVFLDAAYEPEGRERESVLPVVKLALSEIPEECIPTEPEEKGSHPRWAASFGALRPLSPQKIELPPLEKSGDRDRPSISASALDNYSRCGFLALARNRWRLDDHSEPDTDLWPQMKGILLHESVRLLVQSRDANGSFSKSVEEVVELAWKEKRPVGLLRGARIEAYVKRRLAMLLRVFSEQERKYVQRAQTRVVGLEDVKFEIDYEGFTVRGEPDRIDEHPDGLWIMDYKTSSSAPNGATMLENGYRLQLPFYGVASQKKLGKPTLGFQFVQLDRKGTRTNGVYFKSHNGKDPGKLTDTTARSKSLLDLSKEDVWEKFDDQIQTLGADLVAGKFEARPRISPRAKECDSCPVNDFCGYRRILDDAGGEAE